MPAGTRVGPHADRGRPDDPGQVTDVPDEQPPPRRLPGAARPVRPLPGRGRPGAGCAAPAGRLPGASADVPYPAAAVPIDSPTAATLTTPGR